MKKRTKMLLLLLLAFGLMQLIRPGKIENAPARDLAGVPDEVNAILRRACFDCHSTEVDLRWYDRLTPANFLVASHIREGRAALNFAGWDSLAAPQRNALLFYGLNKVLSGEMPLPDYTRIHPSAKLGDQDIRVLKDYLVSVSPRKPAESLRAAFPNPRVAGDSFQVALSNFGAAAESLRIPGSNFRIPAPGAAHTLRQGGKEQGATSHPASVLWLEGEAGNRTVQPAPNGISYIPGYRTWKAISTTDRFDNGSMRIIFANDVALQAIASHQVNPWPDGSVFAKAAWKQQTNKDGSISAGPFIQVEFMIKDKNKYKDTGGWGWARWKGNDLKPYGANASFSSECLSCHRPMKDQDLVFTQPLDLTTFVKTSNQ